MCSHFYVFVYTYHPQHLKCTKHLSPLPPRFSRHAGTYLFMSTLATSRLLPLSPFSHLPVSCRCIAEPLCVSPPVLVPISDLCIFFPHPLSRSHKMSVAPTRPFSFSLLLAQHPILVLVSSLPFFFARCHHHLIITGLSIRFFFCPWLAIDATGEHFGLILKL